ncbi:MAG: hypothetical protein ACI9FB_002071 [Candidatus Azotimanducaceae bacterium]|jgi:hypothetical protein
MPRRKLFIALFILIFSFISPLSMQNIYAGGDTDTMKVP